MNTEAYAEVKRIFLRATRIPPAQRDTFVQRACGGRAEVLHEVQTLLSHHRESEGVDEPTAEESRGLQRLVELTRRRLRTFVAASLGAIAVIAAAVFTNRAIDNSLADLVEVGLITVRDGRASALQLWARQELQRTEDLVRSADFAEAAGSLATGAGNGEESQKLDRLLSGWSAGELAHWFLVDQGGRILASGDPAVPTGSDLPAEFAPTLTRVLVDGSKLTPVGLTSIGSRELGLWSPVFRNGKATAALQLRVDPSRFLREFAPPENQKVAANGGRSYLFDPRGTLFAETPEGELTLRDPGVPPGKEPLFPPDQLPLTRMAAAATGSASVRGAMLTGADLSGYRDHRGILVLGAWRWLPDLGLGVASEIDRAQAFRAGRQLDSAFWILIGGLTLAAIWILWSHLVTTRLRRSLNENTKLGAYTLREEIGRGGLGTVYLGTHDLLARPTAVKVLRDVHGDALERFEREVQLTSRLTHPNTVEVYDFGTTPEGGFYYAMEYLPGLTLAEVVAIGGPMPVERVLHVLLQVCASLAEAHDKGMIHRDIKTRNVMLCERGGVFDFVKVLDFGLVKDLRLSDNTGFFALAGTPLYMPPERLREASRAEPRTDIYSLGILAFVLLTGREPYSADTPSAVIEQVVHREVPRISEHLRDVDPGLEDLVRCCMAKDLEKRPKDMHSLIASLRALDEAPWSQNQAREWWLRHAPAELAATL